MRYAIRDDDTCFFTSPEELESAYKGLPNHCISLSVTPFAVPNHGVGKEPFGQGLPWGYYSIENNTELLKYLQKRVREGSCEILLHGYAHEYQNQKPEMIWKSEKQLFRELKSGKQLLERVLKTKICVFVAPSNAIDRKGEAVLEKLHMDYCGILGRGESRRLSLHSISNFAKRWWVRILVGIQYPGILDYGGHRELNAFPLRDYESFSKQYAYCRKKNLPFVIYTHYWELNQSQQKRELLSRICRQMDGDGVSCVPLSSIYRNESKE